MTASKLRGMLVNKHQWKRRAEDAIELYEGNITEYEADWQASRAREEISKRELAKANAAWVDVRNRLAESIQQCEKYRHEIRGLNTALDELKSGQNGYYRQVQGARVAAEALHKALFPDKLDREKTAGFLGCATAKRADLGSSEPLADWEKEMWDDNE